MHNTTYSKQLVEIYLNTGDRVELIEYTSN